MHLRLQGTKSTPTKPSTRYSTAVTAHLLLSPPTRETTMKEGWERTQKHANNRAA